MTPPPTDTKRLRELLAEATPGEWYCPCTGTGPDCSNIHGISFGSSAIFSTIPGSECDIECVVVAVADASKFKPFVGFRCKEDAELIVESHNALPGLLDEVERFRRGDFTEDEFQNLCHKYQDADAERFACGCIEYQKKMFGYSPIERKLERLRRVVEAFKREAEINPFVGGVDEMMDEN